MMRFSLRTLRKCGALALGALAALSVLAPSAAHAQYADQTVCNSGYVVYEDYGDSWADAIEQTVCLTYTDGYGFDSYVETDNDYSADFSSEYGNDAMWTYGVSAEAQLVGIDANSNQYAVADSGMVYSATDDSGGQTAIAQISATPQQYLNYQLNGSYLECISGDFLGSCSDWQQNPYVSSTAGWSVSMQLYSSGPTLTWATPRPVVYGTALGATQLDASVGVPGTYVYSPAAGTTFLPGSHTLSVVFTPSDGSFAPLTGSVQLLVLPSNAPPACFQ